MAENGCRAGIWRRHVSTWKNVSLETVEKIERHNVINAELAEILENATPDDSIPVDIWLYEIETKEDRELQIKSLIGKLNDI